MRDFPVMGLELPLETFSRLVRRLAWLDAREPALEVLRQFKATGLRPTTAMFGSVLGMLARTGDRRGLRAILHEVRRLGVTAASE